MPTPTQVKLLRVIEEHKVRRVGAIKTTEIDVRFVSATNRDLELEVQRGNFRKDLYFRLTASRSSSRRCGSGWGRSRAWRGCSSPRLAGGWGAARSRS